MREIRTSGSEGRARFYPLSLPLLPQRHLPPISAILFEDCASSRNWQSFNVLVVVPGLEYLRHSKATTQTGRQRSEGRTLRRATLTWNAVAERSGSTAFERTRRLEFTRRLERSIAVMAPGFITALHDAPATLKPIGCLSHYWTIRGSSVEGNRDVVILFRHAPKSTNQDLNRQFLL